VLAIPNKGATEIISIRTSAPCKTNLIRRTIEGNLLSRSQFFHRTLENESHITLPNTTTIPNFLQNISSPHDSNNEAMSEPILLEVKKVGLSYAAHCNTSGIWWS